MATIAAAHDLSGVGRCSLVSAISVLASMGHRCCPLPTAVLSQQTALPGYSYVDFTPFLPQYIAGWEALPLKPDVIFTGFLGSKEQPVLLAEYAKAHPEAALLVDPVMGDGGRLFPCYDMPFVESMAALVERAAIITPNPTEFLLLARCAPDAALPREDDGLLDLAGRLPGSSKKLVIITGVAQGPGQYCNMLLDFAAGTVERLPCRHTGVSYNGTGDLFASIVSGCIAQGDAPRDAVAQAADFISEAADAMPPGADPRHGLAYEPFLHRLRHKE